MFHYLGLAQGLRRVNVDDVQEAKAYMAHKTHPGHSNLDDEHAQEWEGELWGMDEIQQYRRDKPGRCVILIYEFVVDVTGYLGEHVGQLYRCVHMVLTVRCSLEEPHCYASILFVPMTRMQWQRMRHRPSTAVSITIRGQQRSVCRL
jgi:hypothetical protein